MRVMSSEEPLHLLCDRFLLFLSVLSFLLLFLSTTSLSAFSFQTSQRKCDTTQPYKEKKMRLLKTFLTSAYPFVKHSSLSFEPGARSFERSARTVCSAWKKFDACAPFSASARATAILSTIFQHILHHQRSMSCGPKSPQSAPSELQLERRGPLCVVLLNRPKALNSLTTKMVEDLGALLAHWERSDDVAAVVAKGAGGKAFCAGGDVKAVATKGREGDAAEARRFFRSEYRMNAALSHFEKPYIAILDGITMGGGAGVSVHGPVRVATEKTVFAMPECAIGLFPDVGGSYFLSRLSNGLGLYLGLTGARLKGVDVLHAGIATHYIPSVRIPEAEDAIAELGWQASSLKRVNDCLFKIQQEEEIPEGELNGKIDVIDDIFGRERKNVEEIYEACDRYSSTALGREIANQLRK